MIDFSKGAKVLGQSIEQIGAIDCPVLRARVVRGIAAYFEEELRNEKRNLRDMKRAEGERAQRGKG